MRALSELAAKIALGRVGPSLETAGRNRGTEPDRYAMGVGLKDLTKGYPWCTSGLYDVFREASEQLGVRNPFPKTAKAVRVWELRWRTCYEPDPAPGRVYVLDHGAPGDILTEWKNDRYTNDGHIGIVAAVNNTEVPIEVELPDIVATLLGVSAPGRQFVLAPSEMLEVSGNTFAKRGSREGNAWGCHRGTPEVIHGGVLLGYLDLDSPD